MPQSCSECDGVRYFRDVAIGSRRSRPAFEATKVANSVFRQGDPARLTQSETTIPAAVPAHVSNVRRPDAAQPAAVFAQYRPQNYALDHSMGMLIQLRPHSTPTIPLAFLLAGALTACAPSALSRNSPPRSQSRPAAELGSEVPPDPASERQGRWHAPLLAAQGAGKLAWIGTTAPSPCRAAVGTGPVIRIDNELDFQALFCRASDVDWQHLQLLVYRLAPHRALLTEDVVLSDSQINWLLVPRPCPDWVDPPPQPAVLIARSGLPVVALPKPAVPADCPATSDGYGY